MPVWIYEHQPQPMKGMTLLSPAILFLLASDPALAAGPDRDSKRPAGAILVFPGGSIQQSVDASPPGAVFFLLPGVYRDQSVLPKSGDAFIGAPGAVLNGAVILADFRQVGNLYVAHTRASPSGLTHHGQCRPDAPRCDLPRALFRDGRLLRAVARRDQVEAGAWFLDDSTGEVYVADDTAGHTLELTEAPFAFGGQARNVTVANLVIEKFASANQRGAVNEQGRGVGWTVRNNEVRWNYGYGIRVGSEGRVVANRVHHNGEMGVGGGEAENLTLEGNEIAYNVWNGVSCEWECGGVKWGHVRCLMVRRNYVHNNQGPGIWSDESSADVRYEANKIEGNLGAGIAHEISFDAIIKNNVVRGNGVEHASWGWHAQIQVQNSAAVEVSGNFVMLDPQRGGNGISVIEQDRGPAHRIMNVFIRDNDVVRLGNSGNVAGYFTDCGGAGITDRRVRFEADRYHVLSLSSGVQAWMTGRPLTFAEWQESGEDEQGGADETLTFVAGSGSRHPDIRLQHVE